jgi:hypothetical protein
MESGSNFEKYQGLTSVEFQAAIEKVLPFKTLNFSQSIICSQEQLNYLAKDEHLSYSIKIEFEKKLLNFLYKHKFQENELDKINFIEDSMEGIILKLATQLFQNGNIKIAEELVSIMPGIWWEKHAKNLDHDFLIQLLDEKKLVYVLKGLAKRNLQQEFVPVYRHLYEKLMFKGLQGVSTLSLIDEIISSIKMYFSSSKLKQLLLSDLTLIQDMCLSMQSKIKVPFIKRRKELLLLFYYRYEFDFGIYTSLMYAYSSENSEIFQIYLRFFKEMKDKKLNMQKLTSLRSLIGRQSEDVIEFFENDRVNVDILNDGKYNFGDDGLVEYPVPESLDLSTLENHDVNSFPVKVSIDASGDVVHRVYVDTQKHLGRFEVAIQYICDHQLYTNDFWSLELAELNFKLGKLDEAMSALWKLDLDAINSDFRKSYLYLLGKIFFNQGKYLEAFDSFEKVYLLDRNYSQIKYYMAKAKEYSIK